jgi:hypothetical protein
VYNLEVETWHTYFVSLQRILVHNMYDVKGKPGSATWRKAVKHLREATRKGNNYTGFASQQEAEQFLKEARPDLPHNSTYIEPRPKRGYEIHPPDGSGVDSPHLKWYDWSGGKQGGAEGHIYFLEEE